ncbi:outer membrane protein assembly factor BamB family protein [Actinoplanes palleronii]|uniref:Pyrrolo-quinoline quinone repeat domain-containing protein n=1 Tax=Actinoplanes palleronii TaxID=113570 RepID=A0ABQ4B484_9ACTN|nr:PQQ-binding-like beta-propeller repeat protein [Actinoplanes palleronii]GIE65474.1 hypothetical protein Apa02nite_015820 [Actinoplanes palleronii]
MATIELGDLSERTATPGAAPELRADRLLTRVVAAGLAVLCAAGLTGSGPPAPPRVHELWSIPVRDGDYPYLSGDAALLSRVTDAGAELTSYDLGTGRVRWATLTGPESNWLIPDDDAHRIYVADGARTYTAGSSSTGYATSTVVLDSGTGAVRWRHTGQALAASGGTALFADWDEQARVVGLHLLRAADGTPVWEHPIAPASLVLPPPDAPGTGDLIAITPSGTMTALRYADGVPLATRKVGARDQPPWMALVRDGRFYDIVPGTTTSVTAYRSDTLAELWRITWPDSDVILNDCHPVLCTLHAGLLAGLDPATGRARWQLPQADAYPIGGGRLLITRPDTSSSTVVDAATGTAIGPQIPGSVLGGERPGGELVVTRAAGYPELRTAVSLLDPATGRTRLIGSMPGITTGCETVRRYLVCGRENNRLTVTDAG